MRLPFSVQQHAILYSVNAPTLQADTTEKDKLCIHLCSLLRSKTPTLQETVKAIEQLKCGKAAGIDG